MQKIQFTNDENQFVFDAILKHKPNLNYQILNTLLRKRDIRVNNKKIASNQQVSFGDEICLFLPDKKQTDVKVVFENEQIIIVFKPQGVEVTKTDKAFLQSECLEDIFDGFYACHRLDKNTEGLVVLAKNEKIRDVMFECFKQHKIQKNYKTIAFGNIKKQEQFVDYHKKINDKVYIFDKEQKDCSKIITSYVLEQTNGELSLLDVNIQTGKTHQIRAQLAHHGIFILGDERYGQKEMNKKYKAKKQLLCAYKLSFVDMPKILQNLNNKTVVASPTFLSKFGF